MNAVEIEEAVSDLAEQPFDREAFVFEFLLAFGNKQTAIKRLRSNSNSDIPGAVLQKNNIHIATCATGETAQTLNALREHPKTARNKCKFILATDGAILEAEDTNTGEHIVCKLPELPDHFGFFLPLAGISTVSQIKNNPIDIRATRHLNKLYIALLSENPDWAAPDRRHDLNQFMARLIFCFFAEDTGIFFGENLFTKTLTQFSAPDSSNTHEVISELFRAMDTPIEAREKGAFRNWANAFPYVNGGLFAGTRDVPKFSKMARATLLAAGGLKWTHINPDIFGSMIQAVADEDERGALGMHYTSVPNIMKVLGPLFLDELTEALQEAADNGRKLLNLRRRLARIRVFDPACGSGNFLVIAYIRMREIEHEIIRRRKDDPKSVIKLTQFYGIEIKSFPAEIARLALLIAEFQCNVRMIGQQEAILDILPLHQTGNIRNDNALRVDWLEVCPPPKVSMVEDGAEEAWETYICGNPPYVGSRAQARNQKDEIAAIFGGYTENAGVLDYVAGWFMRAAAYGAHVNVTAAFVSTNSICQGQQVPVIWPLIFETGHEIVFAHTSFKWANLASNNAGVTVVVVGMSKPSSRPKTIYSTSDESGLIATQVANINPYLAPSRDIFVRSRNQQISGLEPLERGSAPTDDGAFFFDQSEYEAAVSRLPALQTIFHRAVGGADFIRGHSRWVLKPTSKSLEDNEISAVCRPILEKVARFRSSSKKKATQQFANSPSDFPEDRHFKGRKLFVPQLMSEGRDYVVCGLLGECDLVLAPHFQASAKEVYVFAVIASRLHLVWIATVCGKLETRYRYSNTLGWNTFPVPKLTEANKADLTRCAEDILLTREAHFPATIADLYEPEKMPENLRAAHERNDTVLEEIYIGRRFRNDTERLEKLFDMYTKMTKKGAA